MEVDRWPEAMPPTGVAYAGGQRVTGVDAKCAHHVTGVCIYVWTKDSRQLLPMACLSCNSPPWSNEKGSGPGLR